MVRENIYFGPTPVAFLGKRKVLMPVMGRMRESGLMLHQERF